MTRIEADPGKREFLQEISTFSGAPDEEAALAFDRLFAAARPRLARYLLGLGFAVDVCDDLLQVVATRVWASRASFEARGEGGWWRFLQKIAYRCAIDEERKNTEIPMDALDGFDEIPDRDLPYLDVLLADAEDRERVYAAADALWLGISDDKGDGRSRLLAAQLFYLHGLDWRDIAQILGRDVRTGRAELDLWLTDESVLRHLAFLELYWSNHRLAGHVLRPEEPLSAFELDLLNEELRQGVLSIPILHWTKGEATVLLWRIRNGLTTDQILRFRRCEYDRDGVESIVEKARGYYPFSSAGGLLRDAYEAAGHMGSLQETGVWRRLVFQYFCSDELPQKQILERTAPAAEAVDAKMTGAMLNSWISMNRLLAQLAVFCSEGRA